MFGDPIVAASAERTLQNMVMIDKQQISTYIIEFLHWAPYTGWGSISHGTKFYDGLPHHIKQEFQYMEHPRVLIPLQKVASSLEQCHYEVGKDISGSSQQNHKNLGNHRILEYYSATTSTLPMYVMTCSDTRSFPNYHSNSYQNYRRLSGTNLGGISECKQSDKKV